MDNLNINTGIKRISINGDPNNVITFNPADVIFAERFYSTMQEFEGKQAEYQRRANKLDTTEVDANGIPVHLGESLALLREVCEFMREKIDHLFGIGTSQKAFGDALSLDMFAQFFDGIVPFIQQAREAKTVRYLNNKLAGKVMK